VQEAENVRHLDSGGLDLCKVVGVLDSLKLAEGVVDGVMERLACRPVSTIDELFDVLMKSGVSVANGYRIKNAVTDLKLFPARERDVHPMVRCGSDICFEDTALPPALARCLL
jgi:hypothetical protein